jgi:predicted RNase H-like nuclease (RuvC/YqgF family)
MADPIKDAILEAIDKNLPSQVGESLKKRLDQLIVLEKKIVELEESNTHWATENEALRVKNNKLAEENNALKSRESAAILKEKELAVKETKLTLDLLKCELTIEHSKEKVTLMKDLFAIPFANRVLRESLLTPMTIHSEYIQNGNYDNQKGNNSEHVVRQDRVDQTSVSKTVEEA